MNPTTSQLESTINHVLAALRDAPTPTGLEDRITRRVLQANAERARSSNTPLFAAILEAMKASRILFANPTIYGLAAALLAAAFLTFHHHPKPTVSTQSPISARIPSPQPQPAVSAENVRTPTSKPANHPHPPTSHVVQCDCDLIALAETQAPSKPAPPLPLTSQERYLLSVLRSGGQQEIAALNPVERDAALARENANFRQFFALSPQ